MVDVEDHRAESEQQKNRTGKLQQHHRYPDEVLGFRAKSHRRHCTTQPCSGAVQSQADAEAAKAQDAANKAGRVAAQLYRNGGDDTSMELFFSGSAASADDLLARLGTMDKLIERNQAVYADAITARNSAQSLSDQAIVARTERDRLQVIAEQKMVQSQQAADTAQAALEAQTLHLGELQAQLAALQDATAKTIADYQAGVEAARIAEEQRRAAERAEAERLAAAAAASGGGCGLSPRYPNVTNMSRLAAWQSPGRQRRKSAAPFAFQQSAPRMTLGG